MNPLATLRKHGVQGTAYLYWSELLYQYARIRTRSVETYRNPTHEELINIEMKLAERGEGGELLQVDAGCYKAFSERFPFPPDYHGGMQTGYWHEKIFEHFVSHMLLDLDSYGPGDIYLDVAAGGSPWVKMLREFGSIEAYAIDVTFPCSVKGIDYYREEDATRTSFASSTIRGISLHCAYEMLTGDSDRLAIIELGRILRPGGAIIIVPLYLHTHYCSYSSPEYWGRGFSDSGAHEYVRRDSRAIPSSRKYDPDNLRERVLETARSAGLTTHLYCLRGQSDISTEIYCHFLLELRKPHDSCQ